MRDVFERSGAGDVLAGGGCGAGQRAVSWLTLAATPTFVLMAGLTAGLADGGGGHAMICMSGSPDSWLAGMTPMYLLMAGFHAGPWTTLLSRFPPPPCRSSVRGCASC